jgi:hypothetical protein
VTRLVAAALLLALLVSGTAFAARGDPQRQIRPADQARAKAMLLRKADLPRDFKASASSPGADFYCKALDESDLTLTGDANSPDFGKPPFFSVSSAAQVYESVADANASWRRGTSAAGLRCVRRVFAQELAKQGGTLRSFKRIAFPKVARRSVAFRIEARSQGVSVFFDFPVMQHTRAHVSLVLISALAPVPRAEQVRLARVLAGRTAKAMRGA